MRSYTQQWFPSETYSIDVPENLKDKKEFSEGYKKIYSPQAWTQTYEKVSLKIENKKMHLSCHPNGSWDASMAKPNTTEESREVEQIIWMVDGAYNYVHFLHSIVPRFELTKKAHNKNTLYIVEDYRGYKKEILEDRLKIPANQIVELKNNTNFKCEKFITTCRPVGLPNIYPLWAIEFTRSIFADKLEKEKKNKYYISRNDATKRRVNNEKKVIEAISEKGFQAIKLADYSVAEQAEIFNSAEVIIAPHGAGLGNLVFGESPTKLIEIFNPYYTPSMYFALSKRLGMQYEALFSENKGFKIPGETSIPFEVSQSINIDVDIDKLLSLI